MKTDLTDFDFDLPEELIAQNPLPRRGQSRLMVVNRKEKTITHDVFSNLGKYLKNYPLMVFNNTQVVPAKIFATLKEKMVSLILVQQISPGIWKVLMRGKMKPGAQLTLHNSSLTGTFIKRNAELAIIQFSSQQVLEKYLEEII